MKEESLKEDEIFIIYQMKPSDKKLSLSLWAASRMIPNQEIHFTEFGVAIHKMHKKCVNGVVKTLKRYHLKYLPAKNYKEAYQFATLLKYKGGF